MADDGYGSIRAPEEAIERAREQKEAADRTWGEQIVRPDGEGVARYGAGDPDPVDYVEGWPEEVSVDFPTSDVKEALREVLKEELPPGALR